MDKLNNNNKVISNLFQEIETLMIMNTFLSNIKNDIETIEKVEQVEQSEKVEQTENQKHFRSTKICRK